MSAINNHLNVLKVLAAFLVVCLHCSFPVVGRFLNPLARIAVPVFFMISGYYIMTKTAAGTFVISRDRSLKRLINALWFVIVPIVAYFAFNLIYDREWHLDESFLIFNAFPVASHLWYCFAYIYVMFLALVAFRWIRSLRLLFYIAVLLLICNVLLGSYSWMWNFDEWTGMYTRNFLFVGLPFFLLGAVIAGVEDKITWNRNVGLFMIFSMTALLYVEAMVLKTTGLRAEGMGDLYISTIPLVVLIFVACLKSESKVTNPLIVRIGQRYSAYIYLYHMLVLYLLDIYVIDVMWRSVLINPLAVFVITLLFVMVADGIYLKVSGLMKYNRW